MTNRLKSILCAWYLVPASVAYSAEVNPKVPLESFKCLVENHERYLTQEGSILVNFKTCPAMPSELDRLKVRGLSGSLPAPRVFPYLPVEVLEFTPEQIKCLVKNAEVIILEDKIENYIAIEPLPCGTIGFPVFDEN